MMLVEGWDLNNKLLGKMSEDLERHSWNIHTRLTAQENAQQPENYEEALEQLAAMKGILSFYMGYMRGLSEALSAYREANEKMEVKQDGN